VNLVARNYRDRRRACQSIGFDVPARAGEHCISGCGQGGEIGGRRTGHKSGAGAGRQLQEIQEPPQCNSLEVRNSGRAETLQQPHGQVGIAGVRGHSPIELAQIASRRRWSGYGPLIEAFQVGPRTPDRIIENRIHMMSLRSNESAIVLTHD
jgi:hypothetical protein